MFEVVHHEHKFTVPGGRITVVVIQVIVGFCLLGTVYDQGAEQSVPPLKARVGMIEHSPGRFRQELVPETQTSRY